MIKKIKVTYTTEFKARPGAWFSNTKAKIYGRRLKQLSKLNNNQINSKIVLADAKNKISPLHDAFEWNNSKAGRKWRLHQAALLVNHIIQVYVYDTKKVERPICFSLCDEISKPRFWVQTEMAMQDPLLKQKILQQALWELDAWKFRYQEYEELEKILTAIKNTKRKINI